MNVSCKSTRSCVPLSETGTLHHTQARLGLGRSSRRSGSRRGRCCGRGVGSVAGVYVGDLDVLVLVLVAVAVARGRWWRRWRRW